MDAPPLDLQLCGPYRTEAPVLAAPKQRVEAGHQRAGLVRVVAGVRIPDLIGSQHQPRSYERSRPAHPEGGPDKPYRRGQERHPFPSVIGLPRTALPCADHPGVEGPHGVGTRSAATTRHQPRPTPPKPEPDSSPAPPSSEGVRTTPPKPSALRSSPMPEPSTASP